MKQRGLIFLILCVLCSGAFAEAALKLSKYSSVPASVSDVHVERVNDFLIRVIQHNMEINPKIEIERLTTPDFTVVDYFVVNAITLNGKTWAFNDSQGAFVEQIIITKTAVEIVLDFYFTGGGSGLIHCAVDFQSDHFVALPCHR